MNSGRNKRKERLRQTNKVEGLPKTLQTLLDTSKTLNIPNQYHMIELYTGNVTKLYLAEDISHPPGFRPSPDKVLKFPKPKTLKEGIESIENDNRAVGGLKLDNVVEIEFKQLMTPNACEPVPMEIIEYMDAGTIMDTIKIHSELSTAMPWQLAGFVISRAARGINQLYVSKNEEGERRKIVHRDISPENIGIGFGGRVKIMDFGSALEEGEHHSKTPEIGKIEYMSPEQATYALVAESLHQKIHSGGSWAGVDIRQIESAIDVSTRKMQVSQKDDIYALGITAYYLLTGKNPNRIGEHTGIYDKLEAISKIHSYRERYPLTEIGDQVKCDKNLSLIIGQCCDPDPKKRPKASELIRLLERECLYKTGFGPTTESLAAWIETIHGIFYEADEQADQLRRINAPEEEAAQYRKKIAKELWRQKDRWKYVRKDCPFLYSQR